jgi:hypothetical protein
MGMYTEFHFNVQLKDNLPKNILNILKFMVNDEALSESYPDHPLFLTDRWPIMLQMDSSSFDAQTHSTLKYDGTNWKLNIRCNLKNQGQEIEKFVYWIMPYLNNLEGDFLGFFRYERTQEPVLIHKLKKE